MLQLDFTGIFFLGVWWTLFVFCLYDSDPISRMRNTTDSHWRSFLGILWLSYGFVVLGNLAALWRRRRKPTSELCLELCQLLICVLVGVCLAVQIGMTDADKEHEIGYEWYLGFVLGFTGNMTPCIACILIVRFDTVMSFLSIVRVSQTEASLHKFEVSH